MAGGKDGGSWMVATGCCCCWYTLTLLPPFAATPSPSPPPTPTTPLPPPRDNIPRLVDFSRRFTVRFCELMYDVDVGVAVAGLGLLRLLVAQEVVPHKDVGQAYRLGWGRGGA